MHVAIAKVAVVHSNQTVIELLYRAATQHMHGKTKFLYAELIRCGCSHAYQYHFTHPPSCATHQGAVPLIPERPTSQSQQNHVAICLVALVVKPFWSESHMPDVRNWTSAVPDPVGWRVHFTVGLDRYSSSSKLRVDLSLDYELVNEAAGSHQ